MSKEESRDKIEWDLGPDRSSCNHDINTGMAKPPPPKPFPYYPNEVPIEELKRMEVMFELNKWANNDPFMAKRSAETLILLLAEQFNVNLLQLEK